MRTAILFRSEVYVLFQVSFRAKLFAMYAQLPRVYRRSSTRVHEGCAELRTTVAHSDLLNTHSDLVTVKVQPILRHNVPQLYTNLQLAEHPGPSLSRWGIRVFDWTLQGMPRILQVPPILISQASNLLNSSFHIILKSVCSKTIERENVLTAHLC